MLFTSIYTLAGFVKSILKKQKNYSIYPKNATVFNCSTIEN